MPIRRRGRDPSKLFTKLNNRVKVRAPDALLRAALVLEGNWKNILLTPGTGRIYKRGKVTHQASAPGEPPAPDFGDLQRSICASIDQHREKPTLRHSDVLTSATTSPVPVRSSATTAAFIRSFDAANAGPFLVAMLGIEVISRLVRIAWDAMTGSAREAKKKVDDLTESLLKNREAARPEDVKAAERLRDAKANVAAAQRSSEC